MPEKNIFENNPVHHRDTLSELHRVCVHPCVIDNQPHIVYPRGLQEQKSALFHQLHHYYTTRGYTLKEDQRKNSEPEGHHHERRRWGPIILFTATLLFERSLYAGTELEVQDPLAHQVQQVELHMVSNQRINSQIEQKTLDPKQQGKAAAETMKSATASELFEILQSHYHQQESDPAYILGDFREIANYYSEFPEAITMLEALKDKNWQLSYDDRQWVTVASGNAFQVDKAVIHFNTRAAAQLRLNDQCQGNPVCIASPADALLHELLHTRSMLIDTDQFIAQGGMDSMIYPYQHEYAVIASERRLYASMSRRDSIKRPQRSDHTGRTVVAHCPICIK